MFKWFLAYCSLFQDSLSTKHSEVIFHCLSVDVPCPKPHRLQIKPQLDRSVKVLVLYRFLHMENDMSAEETSAHLNVLHVSRKELWQISVLAYMDHLNTNRNISSAHSFLSP